MEPPRIENVDVSPCTRIGRVSWFVVAALAFSWAHWLAVIASQRGWLTANLSLSSVAIFGPLVAAVVVLIGEPDDRRRRFEALWQWHTPHAAAAIAVLLPSLTCIGCLMVATSVTPGAPRVPAPPVVTIIIVFAGMFVTAGVGEESGWRGFLLPELRKSFGPLLSSFIVALVWFLWHSPLFWVEGATQQHVPVSSFALAIVAYSLILTWLMEVSNNSTLAAMLFHSTANVCFWFAEAYVKNLPQYHLLSGAYVGVMVAFAAVAAILLVRRHSKPSGLSHPRAG
jgi:membrane protease YdiL (CAAX protease family)